VCGLSQEKNARKRQTKIKKVPNTMETKRRLC